MRRLLLTGRSAWMDLFLLGWSRYAELLSYSVEYEHIGPGEVMLENVEPTA
ncbi:MAG: hypothetical protein VX527_05970 [Planctomycetota bacterium]|nr:hypothetical protein [Planctomycetota bacterium]